MSINRDIQRLAQFAETQEWDVADGGKHLLFTAPDGALVTVPRTPSDWRSVRNTVAELRRHGLAIPRKAQKPKKFLPENSDTLANRIVNSLGLDKTVPTYPHITAIVGQWRSLSWFDEDNYPITEAEWFGPDEEAAVSTVIMMMNKDRVYNATGVLGINRSDPPQRPADRQLRIHMDALRFWMANGQRSFEAPERCSCGWTPADDYIGYFMIAQHIVQHHEKGDTDHAPTGGDLLQSWVDPTDLELLLSSDDSRVAELEAQVADLRRRLREEEQRFKTLREQIAALVR